MNPYSYRKLDDKNLLYESSIEIKDEEQFVPLFLAGTPPRDRLPISNPTYAHIASLHTRLSTACGKSIKPLSYHTIFSESLCIRVQTAFAVTTDLAQLKVELRKMIKEEILKNFYVPLGKEYTIKLEKAVLGNLHDPGSSGALGNSSTAPVDVFTEGWDALYYQRGHWFVDFGVLGRLLSNSYSFIKNRHYKIPPSPLLSAEGLGIMLPELLVVIRAKYLPLLHLLNTLEIQWSVPISDIKLLSTSLPSLTYTSLIQSKLKPLLDDGLRHELVSNQVMSSYLYKPTPKLNKEEYMKNVLNHLGND